MSLTLSRPSFSAAPSFTILETCRVFAPERTENPNIP